MSDKTNRREFLQRSAAAAAVTAGVAGGGAALGATSAPFKGLKPKGEAVLKLSSQEGAMPGDTLEQKLDNMERWGYEGLEVGGGKLWERVDTYKKALKGRPIKISAICAGFEGWIIADDKAIRDKAMASMKRILDAAGELESTGLIIVPAFNSQAAVPHKDARVMLTGFKRWDRRGDSPEACLFQELGDHAQKAGTRILLEPLNRDECYFLRTLAHGASICKDLQNPGIALMGDFWHMTWEETSDLGAFLSGGDHVHHVHIASRRRRKTPGEDGAADNYVDGFKGLKLIGYQDFVSLECGSVGDKNVVVPRCADMLRAQWEMA